MRYFIRFSYLGTDFHGSQTQPNGITVQEVLENAFATILREPVPLTFAGRTDAGVHARAMVAHFDYHDPSLDQRFAQRINSLLPYSIAVQDIWQVADDCHARFSAKEREYEYHITASKDPFLYGRCARVAMPLDFVAMNEAAQTLIGKHDFASFCRVHTDVKTTFCNVTYAQWEKKDDTAVFTIRADRFLRNMVRAVVGTLLDVGRGKLSLSDFQRILTARNRCAASQSAPACGLYLTRITY